ncbi:LysR substrate-binding domain-containing protein [Streptomyces nodosus]|uniref:LysR substrate-binding domain-containing protein n=1 Tax=Streptomyces nodosus TaxID=40318 RepID=UPI0037FDE186
MRTVLTEPFVAVLPSGHPFAAQRTVHVGQLADSPFVLLPREAGPGLYDRITGLCADTGSRPGSPLVARLRAAVGQEAPTTAPGATRP